METYGRRW